MDDKGRVYRKVLEGTADPTELPKDLRQSLKALQTKTVDGVAHTPTCKQGPPRRRREKSSPPQNKSGQVTGKNVAKGKAAGDSGVTTDMLRLAPAGLFESYRDIANATLAGGCIPDSWEREVMFPIEKIEEAAKIEKHRPIMLTEADRNACTGILIKQIRRVWDGNQAINPRNSGFARGASAVEPIITLRTRSC